LTTTSATVIAPGSDCRDAFRASYQNRYTWVPGFSGYSGRCIWLQGERSVEGTFHVGADLKAKVEGVSDPEVEKAFASQLWEVCIHRVRRTFEQTHSENTFTAGDCTDEGLEVIIGGKGEGDKYRIKNDIVTMVHRHIRGTVVTIHTKSTTDTGAGYLSHTYTSEYADPATGEPRGGKSTFEDRFVPLQEEGPWVLESRSISTKDADGSESQQLFQFVEMTLL
jgi:hypothetical protein